MNANTFAEHLLPDAVSMKHLEEDYRPMLKLVKELIGVVPVCDPFLEIWPTAFRSYNLLVPNLLNLPAAVMGRGQRNELVGLALYSASRAADCMYCSAHTCSFALRRGASPEAIVGNHNETEAIVASVAESISRVPASLNKGQLDELRKHLSDSDIEWVVLGIAMMGFLNKFMDAVGIPLEDEAINDVQDLITQTGWSVGKHGWASEEEFEGDFEGGRALKPKANGNGGNGNDSRPGHEQVPVDNLGTFLRVARQAPAARRLEKSWTKGVSGRHSEAFGMLEDQIGYGFPILASLTHSRAIMAIATVLRDNLDPTLSELGIGPKLLIGLVYANVVGDRSLANEAVQLASQLAPELTAPKLAAVSRFATEDADTATVPSGLNSVEAACVMMAKGGAPSPSTVNEITISAATAVLKPNQIVEAMAWLSIQQLLHRLYVFYETLNPYVDEDLLVSDNYS